MKKLILAAALALATAAIPAPAQAGMFSEVHHAADDSGYAAPIHIQCEDGRRSYLYTGQGSPSRCGAQVRYIIVGSDQAVRCTDMTRPWEGWLYYTTGYRYIESFRTLKCYMQRPI